MIRIVTTKEGEIFVDETGKKNGVDHIDRRGSHITDRRTDRRNQSGSVLNLK